MITERVARTTDVISFGPFTLVASERLLKKEGAPVELGSRTLDILIALVSRPNEVIGKRELLAQVWPDVTVEEGSLRFHIAGLRKALGDGKEGARYITTHAGRGYCFVAPTSLSAGRANESETDAAIIPDASLPSPFDANGRTRRQHSHTLSPARGLALRHHRGLRRGRQDHGRRGDCA